MTPQVKLRSYLAETVLFLAGPRWCRNHHVIFTAHSRKGSLSSLDTDLPCTLKHHQPLKKRPLPQHPSPYLLRNVLLSTPSCRCSWSGGEVSFCSSDITVRLSNLTKVSRAPDMGATSTPPTSRIRRFRPWARFLALMTLCALRESRVSIKKRTTYQVKFMHPTAAFLVTKIP